MSQVELNESNVLERLDDYVMVVLPVENGWRWEMRYASIQGPTTYASPTFATEAQAIEHWESDSEAEIFGLC